MCPVGSLAEASVYVEDKEPTQDYKCHPQDPEPSIRHPPSLLGFQDQPSFARAPAESRLAPRGLVKGYLSVRLLRRVPTSLPNPLLSSVTWEPAESLQINHSDPVTACRPRILAIAGTVEVSREP